MTVGKNIYDDIGTDGFSARPVCLDKKMIFAYRVKFHFSSPVDRDTAEAAAVGFRITSQSRFRDIKEPTCRKKTSVDFETLLSVFCREQREPDVHRSERLCICAPESCRHSGNLRAESGKRRGRCESRSRHSADKRKTPEMRMLSQSVGFR